jgi:hypothetical protein
LNTETPGRFGMIELPIDMECHAVRPTESECRVIRLNPLARRCWPGAKAFGCADSRINPPPDVDRLLSVKDVSQ